MAVRPDVLCLGETMVLLTPTDGSPLDRRPGLAMDIGGAESNVACGLARLGHSVGWASRVGDDPFGRIISAVLTENGVDTSRVEVDPARPTGVFLKDPDPSGTTVHYYRQGSAATAMGPATIERLPLDRAQWIHLSGITPALSPSCGELVHRLLGPDRRAFPARVSFDVNHRPRLWTADPAEELRGLAARADLVLVGRDEAQELWGTTNPASVRALLPTVPELVVKDAEIGATVYGSGTETFVPAPKVEIVEPVGAGDAFAAGYLSAHLHGRPPVERLRAGHLGAAMALRNRGDTAAPLAHDVFERLLAVEAARWIERASAEIAKATDGRRDG